MHNIICINITRFSYNILLNQQLIHDYVFKTYTLLSTFPVFIIVPFTVCFYTILTSIAMVTIKHMSVP